MFFSEDFIKNLKVKIDTRKVYEFLGKGTVRGHAVKCVHPENHRTGDSHPSLAISFQGYKCMAPTCNIQGDCIKLVQEVTGVEFIAAVTFLCATFGIEIPVQKIAKEKAKLVSIGEKKGSVQEIVRNIGVGYVPEEFNAIKENINYAENCSEWHERLHGSRNALDYLSSRGISRNTAMQCFLGFDGENIVIPYIVNSKIVYYSKRSLQGKTFHNPAGEIPIPLGYDSLKYNRIIYLAEGLFDYLTLTEKGHASIAIPGVNNWKMFWNSLLLGNKIMLCFHADEAGVKATHFFRGVLTQLNIPFEEVDWSITKEYPDVKDLNDWILKGRTIEELFHREKQYVIPDVKSVLGELIDLSCYEDAIEMLLAVIIANLMQSDPVWVLLVGPPSVGKTELIRSVENSTSAYFINRITPNTLVSGYTKNDSQYPDILTRIVKPTTFCITDYGSFLSLHPNDINRVFQQFRDIYDGKVHVEYGNGKIVNWKGKVGMVGGVTPEIERHHQFIGRLGDRFLYYRMQVPENKRMNLTLKALLLEGKEEELRKKIQGVVSRFIDQCVLRIKEAEQVIIPESIIEKMAYAADLFSRMRTPVARMMDIEKTIEYRPEPEIGARSVRALKVLIKAIAFINERRHVNFHDYQVALKLCQGSIPSLRLEFTRIAWNLYRKQPDEMAETATFGSKIGKDTASAKYHLNNLLTLRILEHVSTSRAIKWKLRDDIATLIAMSDFFGVSIPKQEVMSRVRTNTSDSEGIDSSDVSSEPSESDIIPTQPPED
jgi:predicted P-loop ATPase/GTPase